MRIVICLVLLSLWPQPVMAESPAERGRYIVEVIAACGNCHTPRGPDGLPDLSRNLAGGNNITDGGMDAWTANITPDPETGIGNWTDEQIIRAFREGIRPDGGVIGPMMPLPMYRRISDSDAKAIVAYLRTVPPVPNEVPASGYPFPLPENWGPPLGVVPEPNRDVPVEYGEYLAGPLGHCMECHSGLDERGMPDPEGAPGAGGMLFHGPWGVSAAANLTPNGIGDRSDEEIRQIITTGIRADGTALLPPMGFAYYANLKSEDVDAIIAYLRSLPPL